MQTAPHSARWTVSKKTGSGPSTTNAPRISSASKPTSAHRTAMTATNSSRRAPAKGLLYYRIVAGKCCRRYAVEG